MTGTVMLGKFDGHEIRPGIFLIGEPTPVAGTNLMRCLASVNGMLAVVELRLKFIGKLCDMPINTVELNQ